MAHPIRIDCRFCNHGFNVDPDRAGQRVKCPKCQNPLVVPAQYEGDEGGSARPLKAGRAESKDVSQRPVAVRHRGAGVKKLVKLVILVAVLAGGWILYGKFTEQNEKPVVDLFAEYASPETDELTRQTNRGLILQKAGPDDLAVGERYAKHEKPEVRALAAAVLGATKRKEAHKPLAPLATKDKDVSVRKAATAALGEIRLRASVETLMEVLARDDEKADVKGDAMGSLRKLTPMNFTNYTEWGAWWANQKDSFKMKDPVE